MYLLPYVILKIILLTSTIAEPVLEILLPAENSQTLKNTDQSNSANDDEKTLAQQIAEGKYGLIHKELFSDIPPRPGIVSYNINPEVPKDNVNNLGGLDPDEIWLAENHLLVLRGGNFSNKKAKWSHIDNYIAPPRQVKIPENPKIPPPFPIQLEDDGPIDFVSVNGSTWNPIFSPSFPPILGPPPLNITFDEDDQSLFYPPKYDFVYAQENSTRVPPGPLVPGIVLPPPPNFFGPLEKPEKAKKINLNTNKTIPRFNQKPYLKIPKGNHYPKEDGWVPIPSVKPNYIEGLKFKNNIPITTTENSFYTNSEQINLPSLEYFKDNLSPIGYTTTRPDPYYNYYEENNKYDVEKTAQHNKYVDSTKNEQFGFQNNYEKSTTVKPYYEYSYIAPEYSTRSQIQNPMYKDKPLVEYQKERPVYQEWPEKQKHTNYNNKIEKQQKHQSWSQQNQHSETDYEYQTEKYNVATDNPYHAFFTQDDASLVDENTKKYFALFGQKVRTEKPAQVISQLKQHSSKNDNKISLVDDTLVNFKQPLPANNPESEVITTAKPYNNYPQISLLDDINVNFKQPRPQKNPNAEIISQNPNDFEANYPYTFNNAAIHNNQQLLPKNINNDNLTKKPYVQTLLQNSTPVSHRKPLQSNNPNLEKKTQRPHLQPFFIQTLFDDTNVNYKHPSESDNSDAEQITQKPLLHATPQSPIYENINYNSDTSYVTRNPSANHINQKPYSSQTSIYNDSTKKNKPYISINSNTDLITQRPYINVPETSIFDEIRVNYKPQGQKYSNSGIVSSRPTLKIPQTSYLEGPQVNYQQNSNTETVVKRPNIKFPLSSLADDMQFNFKRPLPLRNHDTDYFTQRPQSIYQQTPVSLIDDIQVNYKQPLPPKNIDAEYIVPTQRPINRVVSYNLPGNSGSHFFFLTTHTGHPIQYNLRSNNYQYYKTNVK